MNAESGGRWKEAVVAYFKVLPWYLHGETKRATVLHYVMNSAVD
jgi:hypothetical protein